MGFPGQAPLSRAEFFPLPHTRSALLGCSTAGAATGHPDTAGNGRLSPRTAQPRLTERHQCRFPSVFLFPLTDMMNYLFYFVGSATRKEWWLTTLVTLAAEAALWCLCPGTVLCTLLSILFLVPWLAVSSRRILSTGNAPEKGVFCFALLPVILFLMPLADAQTRETAWPLVEVLALVCGIVFLSYAVICGFVSGKKA